MKAIQDLEMPKETDRDQGRDPLAKVSVPSHGYFLGGVRVSRASDGFNFPYLSPPMRVVFPLSAQDRHLKCLPLFPRHRLDSDRPRIRSFRRGNFLHARVSYPRGFFSIRHFFFPRISPLLLPVRKADGQNLYWRKLTTCLRPSRFSACS